LNTNARSVYCEQGGGGGEEKEKKKEEEEEEEERRARLFRSHANCFGAIQ
jgi:hypothetical protein